MFLFLRKTDFVLTGGPCSGLCRIMQEIHGDYSGALAARFHRTGGLKFSYPTFLASGLLTGVVLTRRDPSHG